ncbi:hypothetical protein JKF63_03059 [Porcisia hertigi]|uniref:Uncharacterized protein n=1 Tax=Porcisia hertigi TaxID=2761500 RepID=A0A836L4R9_9TRYP|nr:hypothetical protein JKF63_03059 [Porcisia hertigi]
MDGDPYLYSRPAVVTGDQIKEALEKANRKALKETLDRQAREVERRRVESLRSKGKRGKGSKYKVNVPLLSTSTNVESKMFSASPEVTTSIVGSSFLTPGSTVVSGAIKSTQYTFAFEEAQRTHEVESSSARDLQTTLPPPAERLEREGAAAPVTTSGDAGRTSSRVRRQLALHETDRGTAQWKSHGAKSNAASNGGEYQTNSLPANFTMGRGEAAGKKIFAPDPRVSDGRRPSRGASRERGGVTDASGQNRSKGNASYDTQSLPVELIYKLGQVNSTAAVGKPLLSRVTTPSRPPSGGPTSESRGLQSPLGPLSGIVTGSPVAATRRTPTSPMNDHTKSPYWTGVGGDRRIRSPGGGGKGVSRVLGSGGGVTPKERVLGGRNASPRPSARLAGVILPPLNARNDPDVIEMSAVLDVAAPTREYSVLGPTPGAFSSHTPSGSAQPSSRWRTCNTPSERPAQPTPPLPSPPLDVAAAEQARKQAEREKAWVQQVKQLKEELRKTRTKRGGKGGLKHEARGAMGSTPRRAETAPDPPPHPPKRGGAGAGAGGGVGATGRSGGAVETNGHVGGSRPHQVEKRDFAKAHIFTRENFRPITAPEDAASYCGMLSPFPSLPRLVQPGKLKSREPVQAGLEAAARSEGEETTCSEATYSPSIQAVQTFTSTGTSGEESLKLASLTTRQVTLGLPDYGESDPVPIQFNHLLQFVDAQMITSMQAESLWNFFAVSPEVACCGRSDSNAAHAGASTAASSTRGVRGRPSRDDASGAVGLIREDTLGMKEAEKWQEENGAGAPEGEREGDISNGKGFYVPHSPSQPPTSAVLAPALRRKISGQYSEHEAALFHQPHKPLHNSRLRVSPSGTGTVGSGRRTSPHKASILPSQFSTPLGLHNSGGDENGEGTGTFDTFSELVLSTELKDDDDD